MAENLRTGSVWNSVMSTPDARRALEATGFRSRIVNPGVALAPA
jgi:hypothetical protein